MSVLVGLLWIGRVFLAGPELGPVVGVLLGIVCLIVWSICYIDWSSKDDYIVMDNQGFEAVLSSLREHKKLKCKWTECSCFVEKCKYVGFLGFYKFIVKDLEGTVVVTYNYLTFIADIERFELALKNILRKNIEVASVLLLRMTYLYCQTVQQSIEIK